MERRPRSNRQRPAAIKHINAAGPRAKLEMITDWGDPILVEMDHQRLKDLALQRKIRVFLTPRDEGVLVYDGP